MTRELKLQLTYANGKEVIVTMEKGGLICFYRDDETEIMKMDPYDLKMLWDIHKGLTEENTHGTEM